MRRLVVAVLFSLSIAASSNAKTFTVDTQVDFPNAPPFGGDITCDIGLLNLCSLRAAVQAANQNPGRDEIVFDPAIEGVYLQYPGVGEDFGFTGDLDILCPDGDCEGQSLTITGNGTIIDAAGLFDRAFDVVDPIRVTIRGIEVRNTNRGFTSGDGTAIRNRGDLLLEDLTVSGATSAVDVDATNNVVTAEGAILDEGTLTLNRVTVADNIGDGVHANSSQKMVVTDLTATGNGVAGLRILSPDANVEVNGCSLSDNTIGLWASAGRAKLFDCEISDSDSEADNRLGASRGVLNDGFVTLERCDVRNNINRSGSSGGILNRETIELIDTSITGNDVQLPIQVQGATIGGGMTNLARALIRGSLFHDNTADEGAAIANFATLMVTSSTISGNNGPGISTRNILDQFGGVASFGVSRVYSSTAVLNSPDLQQPADASVFDVRNSIVESCEVTGTASPVIVSLGFNMEATISCGFIESTDRNSVPGLVGNTIASELADNGGFTETHLPNPDAGTSFTSPPFSLSAIDTGSDDVSCPLVDQRGEPRPYLGPCDIGAVEDQTSVVAQCNDGVDNDQDGTTDLDGCSSPTDNLELSISDGMIFAASDDAAAVFALRSDYGGTPVLSQPPVITRGTGLAGPYDIDGNGSEILVVDAFQGLVFQIDPETGIPSIFAATGSLQFEDGDTESLDFPRSLAIASDGDVFAVGSPTSFTGTSIVRIDPETGRATPVDHSPLLNNMASVDFAANGDLLVSQISGTQGTGIFRIVLSTTGDPAGVSGPIGALSTDPIGVASRRSGELVVANRATGDLINLDPEPSDPVIEELIDTSAGDPPILIEDQPRGDAIDRDQGVVATVFDMMGEVETPGVVELSTIVAERDNDTASGSLHRVLWDGTTPTEIGVLATGLPRLYGVWVLRDRDLDGVVDRYDDSDGDGLTDDFETNTGLFVDANHPGTDPTNPDTDADELLDSFEVANGFDPLTGGDAGLDPDEDGQDNLAEQMAGTDPNDGSDFKFAGGIPAVGPVGVAVLAALLLLASRIVFRQRVGQRG